MAATLTNQHYVWKHYLEAWSDPAFYCFRQSEQKLFRGQPKVVANERNFYQTYKLSAGDLRHVDQLVERATFETTRNSNREFVRMFQLSFDLREQLPGMPLSRAVKAEIESQLEEAERTLGERYHTEIEQDAIGYLDELRRGNCAFYDDDVDCSKFLYFLANQYFRTSKARSGVLVGSPIPDHDPRRTAPIEVHIYVSNLGMSLFATRKRRGIVFLNNESEIPFITGDQPIFNVLDPFKTNDVELYYPLSSKLALLLTREQETVDRSGRRVGAIAVETYNHLLYRASDDQVYANDEAYLKALTSTPKDLALDGQPSCGARRENSMTPDYSGSDTVCAAHFNDQGLKDFVAARADSDECSVCGATGEENIAVAIDDLTDHIAACIGQYYDDPANKLPYESAEGGYQGATYSTEEIFAEVDLEILEDSDGSLHDTIVSSMPTDLWCDAEPFMLTRSEQLLFSWESFCKTIKHKRRYFFESAVPTEDSELYGPSEVLRTIFDYAEEAGAFVTLPRGTHLFRARLEKRGERHVSALALGPPPLQAAVQTNRMSPPGIVMAYVADDAETSLAETADKPGRFALADFVTERDALILDLTELPEAPSIFAELSDSLEYDPRVRLNFLHSISREISKPIARDDRAHIEYVPTQVVTEYVRTAVTIQGQPVAGIRYRSSRRRTETALVLFADQNNLFLEEGERPELYHVWRDRWLRLHNVVRRKVTAEDIARWAAPARWTLTP
jgi:HEPN/RES N-terminal domain 1/Protein of unknown function (DUF4238)/RES domain